MIKERIIWIDYVKCIGIYLIVLGHLPITNLFLRQWIFSFHVPLFFMISGVLFKSNTNTNFATFLKNNLMTLILVTVPYYIFGMGFTGIIDFMFYKDRFSIGNNLVNPIYNFLMGYDGLGPIWFLFALFWIRVICYLLSSIMRPIYIFTYSVLVAFIAYYIGFRTNYYQISTALFALPFYSFGALYKGAAWGGYKR